MRRRMSSENVKVTQEGIEFTFDADQEALCLYQECQEKMTDAEIDGKKVILLIPTPSFQKPTRQPVSRQQGWEYREADVTKTANASG